MKVIEFFGMPRAGKTEQIKKLSAHLNDCGIKHLIITDREIEKEIEVPLTEAFEYNILFFNKILEKFLLAKYSKQYDIIILDRGFLDGEVWFNIEHKQKNLSDSEKEIANQYLKKLKGYIDLGFFMTVDPKVTMERHESKGEIGKSDNYVFKIIEGLYQEYSQLKNKLKNNNKVLLLDGNEAIEELHSKIKDRMRQDGII